MEKSKDKEWTVRYVAMSGRIVRMTVIAAYDATEDEVKSLAWDQNDCGIYSSDDIHKIIDVEY